MYGLFERNAFGTKSRVGQDRGLEFASIAEGLAHFGDKVVFHEVSDDGDACDLFVNIGVMGSVYAIERL